MMSTSYNDFNSLKSVGNFLKKRLIRIIPIYYAATVIAFFLFIITNHNINVTRLITSLLFIPDAFEDKMIVEPIVGQGWTLNYEMFFYSIFALALLFPRRISLPVFILLFVSLPLFSEIVLENISRYYISNIYKFYSDPIILLFALGVGVAVVKHEWTNIVIVKNPIMITIFLMCADVIAYYVITAIIHFDMPKSLSFSLSTVCVFVCVFSQNNDNNLFDVMSEKFGDASYSTYLFHTLVLAILNRIFVSPHLIYVVLYIVISIIGGNLLGYGTYIFVERPVTAFLRRATSSRHAALYRVQPAKPVRF